jgi:NADP-dependent 3-hydroxy acid dehydrogenase YdfG
MADKNIFIIGGGVKIGASVARRFAAEGFKTGLIARTQGTIDAMSKAVGADIVTGVKGDAADAESLGHGLDALVEKMGPPDVVLYNAATWSELPLAQLTVADLRAAFCVNVEGLHITATKLLPAMTEKQSGSLFYTSLYTHAPFPVYASLYTSKAAGTTHALALARDAGKSGVHVAVMEVGGHVEKGNGLDPDDIANAYWTLHAEPRDKWTNRTSFPPKVAA